MKDKINGILVKKHDNTAKISVTRIARNKLYGKQYKITKNYLVYNPKDIGEIGNTVEIVPTRPISRRIRWQLKKVYKED